MRHNDDQDQKDSGFVLAYLGLSITKAPLIALFALIALDSISLPAS